jgi:hypothetical protein
MATPPRPSAPGRGGSPGRLRGLPPSSDLHPRMRLSRAVPGLIKHLPHHKPYMVAISAIAIVAVLATCGFGSFLLLHDDSKVITVDPAVTATAATRNIASRQTDGVLMKATDVFPTTQIKTTDPTVAPYKRLGDVQVEANCRVAGTAAIGQLLLSAGCNQVIRATFIAPDGAYYLTAGIFNLSDSTAASNAKDQLSKIISATNRLTGYITTEQTQVLYRSPTNLAFYAQGHFLIYVVIARTDGNESKPDDPNIKVIVYDVLEHYLRDTVLVKWAVGPTPSASAASAKAS